VLRDELHIRTAGATTVWRLRAIAISADPDAVVTLRLAHDPARLVLPAAVFAAHLAPHMRRRPGRRTGWPIALVGCLAVVLAAVLLVDSLPNLLLRILPNAWDARLGDLVEAGLLSRHRACTGADGQRALEAFVARLVRNGAVAPAHLIVADDPLVNAFTLPGGDIVLMRGLIATSHDGDELAGVIAHELGHVAHRDPDRQLLRRLGIGAVTAAIGWHDVGGQASGTLVALSYGRAAETTADEFAVTVLRAAGLRADGLGRFLARTAADHDATAFLSDHPSTADRIARTAQPPTGEPAFTAPDWQSIRAICAPTAT
jgi:predicted Zn-dependent protease